MKKKDGRRDYKNVVMFFKSWKKVMRDKNNVIIYSTNHNKGQKKIQKKKKVKKIR